MALPCAECGTVLDEHAFFCPICDPLPPPVVHRPRFMPAMFVPPGEVPEEGNGEEDGPPWVIPIRSGPKGASRTMRDTLRPVLSALVALALVAGTVAVGVRLLSAIEQDAATSAGGGADAPAGSPSTDADAVPADVPIDVSGRTDSPGPTRDQPDPVVSDGPAPAATTTTGLGSTPTTSTPVDTAEAGNQPTAPGPSTEPGPATDRGSSVSDPTASDPTVSDPTAPTPTSVPDRGPAGPAPALASSFEGGWVAQLASVPASAGEDATTAAWRRAAADAEGAVVVRSDQWTSLRPGFFVIVDAGPFDTAAEVRDFCASIGRADSSACLARNLTGRR